MNDRIHTLKALAHRFNTEIKVIAKDLRNSDLPITAKETIMEKLASLNMVIEDSIESSLLFYNDAPMTLEEMEIKYISIALQRNKGHLVNSAKCLGISVKTLWRRMIELKITISSYKGKREYILSTKHKKKYKDIMSWIGDHKTFWLEDLKKSFGYDSKETRVIIDVVNYLRSKDVIKRSGIKNRRVKYVLAENVTKDDILAHLKSKK